MGKKQRQKLKQLGHQPPQHNFFLNPYQDARFTRCPKCDRPTKLRKKLLLISIEKTQPVSLNKTCRYCPTCDILIAHKDELDALMETLCWQQLPHLTGNDYFVLGTLERNAMTKGQQSISSMDDLLKALHDFKQYVEYEPARYMWVMED
jgi:hypothetical protein